MVLVFSGMSSSKKQDSDLHPVKGGTYMDLDEDKNDKSLEDREVGTHTCFKIGTVTKFLSWLNFGFRFRWPFLKFSISKINF